MLSTLSKLGAPNCLRARYALCAQAGRRARNNKRPHEFPRGVFVKP
ncbi:hypothetical protein HMPREF3208_00660 [Gardnerella vaginalis]|uniref:Uncharacterized protein n=1 Tax=Gardnerella vaginalis TaxID=2702 RepID=A0A133NXV2_GARVA|nr:hypothetical protein HMPREF3208_00660 [Gardnerella vaginalis]